MTRTAAAANPFQLLQSAKENLDSLERILRDQVKAGKLPAGAVRAGALEADWDGRLVKVNGEAVNLSTKCFGILKLIYGGRGRAFSRVEILRAVWGTDFADAVACGSIRGRTVDQHVAQLRKRLGDVGQRIVTISDFGYAWR